MMPLKQTNLQYTTGLMAIPAAAALTKLTSLLINSNDFDVTKIKGESPLAANITLQFILTNKTQQIMSINIPFNDIVGSAQLPNYIKNLRLEAGTQLDIYYTNSGAATTGAITLEGLKNKIYTPLAGKDRFYVYSTGLVTVPVGSSKVAIQVQDLDFMVHKITGYANAPLDLLVQLVLQDKSENLSNIFVPFNDLVGTAQYPAWIKNMMFSKNVNVDVNFQNNNAAPQTVSVTFQGDKLGY
jgi:hypothetical protein